MILIFVTLDLETKHGLRSNVYFYIYLFLFCFTAAFVLLQARPEVGPSEEMDINEEEEKEVDLSVPGSSYIKLLSLTLPSVLPGRALS